MLYFNAISGIFRAIIFQYEGRAREKLTHSTTIVKVSLIKIFSPVVSLVKDNPHTSIFFLYFRLTFQAWMKILKYFVISKEKKASLIFFFIILENKCE